MHPLWRSLVRKNPDEESLGYFLAASPLFADLSPREIHQMEKLVHLRHYDPRELVFSEGDPGSGIYLIRSGRVQIFTSGRQGGEEDLALLGTGDLFGETTLAAPAMRTASARTLEKSELVGLFRADLLELIQKHPALANKLLLGLTRLMSDRLTAAGQELRRLQLALADSEARSPGGAA